MSERLEEIKNNFYPYEGNFGLSPDQVKYLVEQAELNEITHKELVPKFMKLNVFLDERKVGRYGDHKIDIVMDYIEELEKLLTEYQNDWTYIVPQLKKLKEENQHCKQTIEEIRSYMEYDATIMLSDEDRLNHIGEILKDYYKQKGKSE